MSSSFDPPSAVSGGASLLSAAHAIYVDSKRTPAGWADFVDSVQHAMAPLSHAFPDGSQPELTAGILSELPRSGVSAQEMCAASIFDRCIDELFLTQSHGSTHNLGLAHAIEEGASLPPSGLSDLRLLSAVGHRALKELCLQQDPTLEAIFKQYQSMGGAVSKSAYQELVHSLVALSTRWKVSRSESCCDMFAERFC
jgi:hypothetical protein